MLTVIQPRLLAQAGDLSELIDSFKAALKLRSQAGELAENTTLAYTRGLDKFIAWCAARGVLEVTGATLREWKADLLTQGLKPATVNTWLAGCKAFFAWAVEVRRLPYNPAESVKGATRKGTNRRHVREALTDLEIRRLLAQPDTTTPAGKRDLAILSLMAYTGARSVEVCRADLVDLRTESGRLVLFVTGKGHTEADSVVVLANPKAENAMYDWLAIRGDSPGPLFTSLSDRSNGGRLSLRALRGLVRIYYKAAGVRGNKTTHSLRHTAISKAILAGVPVQKVKSMARHESIDTTMIYFHEVDRLTNPAEAFIDYGE